MSFRPPNLIFYCLAAMVLFYAGWACNKYGNTAGVSDTSVVAVVGDHKITFADWMRQSDILRVFFGSPIDPDNKDQMKAVLDSLIDQEVVLQAAQKAQFSSGTFDEQLKMKLQEADQTLKDLRDKLEKDTQTLHRIEKNYQDPYKKMLLARQFAGSRMNDVVVTEKDMRDWYDDYAAKAKDLGQPMPPYSKLNEKIKDEKIKPQVQADKFVKDLDGQTRIERENDVIDKYLNNLSVSAKMLGSDSEGLSLASPKGSAGAGTSK